MAKKATIGPWRVFSGNGVVEVQDAHGDSVTHWTGFDSARAKGDKLCNAKLIALAPEMLDALVEVEAMLDEFDANSDRTQRIRSLIARAA